MNRSWKGNEIGKGTASAVPLCATEGSGFSPEGRDI